MTNRKWKWQPEEKGYFGRSTKARDLVLDFLAQKPDHLSAEEIFQALSNSYPYLGLATIYRLLELLTRLGFLNRLVSQEGQNGYEFKGKLPHAHHHHLICLNFGQIFDTTEPMQEEINLIRQMESKKCLLEWLS